MSQQGSGVVGLLILFNLLQGLELHLFLLHAGKGKAGCYAATGGGGGSPGEAGSTGNAAASGKPLPVLLLAPQKRDAHPQVSGGKRSDLSSSMEDAGCCG